MCVRVCVVVNVCLENSAKKQEHAIAGRNVVNQVRTKAMCNFLPRAERTLTPEREYPTFSK